MSHLVDMRNERFGKLFVVERAENTKNGQARWFCVCDCGNTNIVTGQDLRSGKVRSCGCYKLEQQTKHGDYNTPLYRVWTSMKNRCNCKENCGRTVGYGQLQAECKRRKMETWIIFYQLEMGVWQKNSGNCRRKTLRRNALPKYERKLWRGQGGGNGTFDISLKT